MAKNRFEKREIIMEKTVTPTVEEKVDTVNEQDQVDAIADGIQPQEPIVGEGENSEDNLNGQDGENDTDNEEEKLPSDLVDQTPEDKGDEEEEEQPTEQPEVIAPAVALTDEEELGRIEGLISNLDLDTDATLEAITKSSILLFSILAAKLIDYRDQMHTSKGLLETKSGAGKNNQLYKAIMGILGNKDERFFRVGFALINIVFKTYNESNESYNKYNLTRYDLGWDNQKDLATYNKLVTVIPMLADASTREEEKVKLDFDKLRDKAKTNFTDVIVDRMVSFYNV